MYTPPLMFMSNAGTSQAYFLLRCTKQRENYAWMLLEHANVVGNTAYSADASPPSAAQIHVSLVYNNPLSEICQCNWDHSKSPFCTARIHVYSKSTCNVKLYFETMCFSKVENASFQRQLKSCLIAHSENLEQPPYVIERLVDTKKQKMNFYWLHTSNKTWKMFWII